MRVSPARSANMLTLTAKDISFLGHDLSRPECVIGEPDGTLWTSDSRGGLTRIRPGEDNSVLGRIEGLPNGIAIDSSGRFLVTDIDNGRLYCIERDGNTSVLLDQFEGRSLGALNFVYIDALDRIWLTVSTLMAPRAQALANPIADGCVLLLENGILRRVADSLYFPNEVRIDSDYRYLYVAETAASRVCRYPLLDSGSLGRPEPFGPEKIFDGAWVDGLAFDAGGALWVTEVTRNGIHCITPDGVLHTVIEDPSGQLLQFPSSLAFVGADLTQVMVGSARMTRLATFKWPVAGQPMSHWR